MSSFTTRVELHYATDDQYNTLHNAMVQEGFSRNINADDGTVYRLPPAEYNYEGARNLSEVHEAAKRAATKTGRIPAIFVTESVRRMWSGLEVIKQNAYS